VYLQIDLKMENIKKSFARCKAEKRPALVTYVMAGYPTKKATVDILLGLQRGHADIIELGLPYSDPIADGEAITKASMTALSNGVTIESTLQIVKDARSQGLKVPLLFMGYYNPILSYGEERLLNNAKKAGVDGFIIVDLPTEEAVRLRNYCTQAG
jgi:tryptophan synthase